MLNIKLLYNLDNIFYLFFYFYQQRYILGPAPVNLFMMLSSISLFVMSFKFIKILNGLMIKYLFFFNFIYMYNFFKLYLSELS